MKKEKNFQNEPDENQTLEQLIPKLEKHYAVSLRVLGEKTKHGGWSG